jgi:hypothetical protein
VHLDILRLTADSDARRVAEFGRVLARAHRRRSTDWDHLLDARFEPQATWYAAFHPGRSKHACGFVRVVRERMDLRGPTIALGKLLPDSPGDPAAWTRLQQFVEPGGIDINNLIYAPDEPVVARCLLAHAFIDASGAHVGPSICVVAADDDVALRLNRDVCHFTETGLHIVFPRYRARATLDPVVWRVLTQSVQSRARAGDEMMRALRADGVTSRVVGHVTDPVGEDR